MDSLDILIENADEGRSDGGQHPQPVEQSVGVRGEERPETRVERSHVGVEHKDRVEGDLEDKYAVVDVVLENAADHGQVTERAGHALDGRAPHHQVQNQSHCDYHLRNYGQPAQRHCDQRLLLLLLGASLPGHQHLLFFNIIFIY